MEGSTTIDLKEKTMVHRVFSTNYKISDKKTAKIQFK